MAVVQAEGSGPQGVREASVGVEVAAGPPEDVVAEEEGVEGSEEARRSW